jgi:hypothetical protein
MPPHTFLMRTPTKHFEREVRRCPSLVGVDRADGAGKPNGFVRTAALFRGERPMNLFTAWSSAGGGKVRTRRGRPFRNVGASIAPRAADCIRRADAARR